MDKRNNTVLILLVALVIVTAVFASFGLPLFASPTPTITLPTPAPVTAPPEASGQEDGVRVEVTPYTVQSVIAALRRAESYSREVSVTLEGQEQQILVFVDGGWTQTVAGTSPLTHTIVGDGKVWRWREGDYTPVTWPADPSSADLDGQRVPTYEDVLALSKDRITAAGYEEKNGSPCVYVETWMPELNQTERFWVSADSGLLIAAENETEGEVVWSMTAVTTETPLAQNTGLFTIPDGRTLHRVGE